VANDTLTSISSGVLLSTIPRLRNQAGMLDFDGGGWWWWWKHGYPLNFEGAGKSTVVDDGESSDDGLRTFPVQWSHVCKHVTTELEMFEVRRRHITPSHHHHTVPPLR
jgi:hypothetical protein